MNSQRSAHAHASNVSIAIALKLLGADPILQVVCRDKNRIAIQGDVLGAARIAGIIARGFERIGPRIGPVWSVEQDPLKREQLLEDELRKVQHEWVDEVEKLLGASGA